MIKHLTLISAVLACALLNLNSSWAQESDTTQKENTELKETDKADQGNKKETQTDAKVESKKDTVNSAERFIPSEEVSEDLSVSFPVDI